MELDHVFHPDHKLSYKKSVKRNKEAEVCVACFDEISSEHYCCIKCDFPLHKLCAQRPQELTHSLHPDHPLRLLHSLHEYLTPTKCDGCKKGIKGFIYRCTNCDFNLDSICAFPDGLKLYHLGHPEHVLTAEKVVKRADKGLVCGACLEDISGPLADYYSCRKCKFFVHKLCSESPLELTHSLHPQHTLSLLQGDPYRLGTAACRSCRKPMKGFVYDCYECKFSIDFKCAFPKPEKRIQNLERVHHHSLIFFPRTSKFSCDLCSSAEGDEGEEDQSYACSTCDFMIHKTCALTTLAQRYKEHDHPLSLVQGVTEDLLTYGRFYCDVCHNAINPEDLAAHCARCRYFVHVGCMITGPNITINDAVDYLEDSLIQLALNGDEFVRWPQSDVSAGLIQPFLLGKNGIVMNNQPKIRHVSHEDHDMILFQELCVNNESFFKEEDEEILCDACIHPITAPYYCCQECYYYLHLPCANLPDKISHSSHPDELYLTKKPTCYDTAICDRCNRPSNGFYYSCEKGNFNLDLTCTALPPIILHGSHEHPLFQMKYEDEGLCYCCNRYEHEGRNIFKCNSCNVYLHYECAMYIRSIRHKWDRQHPLDLRIPPHADHPDDILCDMCEELVHPMDWLYGCFKCKVCFHTRCAPKYQVFPNVKYGGKEKMSFHPHILKYLMKPTLKITCDNCEGPFGSGGQAFECETCYDCLCVKCVNDNYENDSEL